MNVQKVNPGDKIKRKIIKRKPSKTPKVLLITAMTFIAITLAGKGFSYIIEDFAERESRLIPYGTRELSEKEKIRLEYENITSDEKLIEVRENILSLGNRNDEFFEKEFDQRIDISIYLYKELQKSLPDSENSKISSNIEFLERFKIQEMNIMSGSDIKFENIGKTTIIDFGNSKEIGGK